MCYNVRMISFIEGQKRKQLISQFISPFFFTVKDETFSVNWEELIHKTVPPAPMTLLSVL